MTRLSCGNPTVDAFAASVNKRCEVWWGAGSPFGQDAFAESWRGHFLWMNPPFSILREALAKLKQDQAHGVLVMPKWPRWRWYKQAQALRLVELEYPKGTKFFKLNGRPCKGTHWPVTVMLVCGHNQKCRVQHDGTIVVLRDLRRVRFDLTRNLQYDPPEWDGEQANTRAVGGQAADQPAQPDQLAQGAQTPPESEPQPPSTQPESTGKAERPRMLDLFSGTGSVGRVYESLGFQVISPDSHPKWKADIQEDVLQ